MDHVSYFKSINPVKGCLVYHAYKDIEMIRDEIKKWMIKNDLNTELYDDNKSWYNKDITSMVVITTK